MIKIPSSFYNNEKILLHFTLLFSLLIYVLIETIHLFNLLLMQKHLFYFIHSPSLLHSSLIHIFIYYLKHNIFKYIYFISIFLILCIVSIKDDDTTLYQPNDFK